MATAFTHALVALALGLSQRRRIYQKRFWSASVMCSILPDADVIGFAMGIPYHHALGHRGLTHSLCFALAVSLVVVKFAFPLVPKFSRNWWTLSIYFFLVTASHGVLDAMTNGGLGIAFFAPFDNTRYFFTWTPVLVSPIGIEGFFTQYGWKVLRSEFQSIWMPVGLCVVGGMVLKRMIAKPEQSDR